jgi:hypothetical protein
VRVQEDAGRPCLRPRPATPGALGRASTHLAHLLPEAGVLFVAFEAVEHLLLAELDLLLRLRRELRPELVLLLAPGLRGGPDGRLLLDDFRLRRRQPAVPGSSGVSGTSTGSVSSPRPPAISATPASMSKADFVLDFRIHLFAPWGVCRTVFSARAGQQFGLQLFQLSGRHRGELDAPRSRLLVGLVPYPCPDGGGRRPASCRGRTRRSRAVSGRRRAFACS